MKLAVCYENGQVFQHFGHTEQFKVYTIENGVITHSEIVSTNGQGHGALAGVLKELGADALICGGIGVSHNINLAPLRGILCAINRYQRKKEAAKAE